VLRMCNLHIIRRINFHFACLLRNNQTRIFEQSLYKGGKILPSFCQNFGCVSVKEIQ